MPRDPRHRSDAELLAGDAEDFGTLYRRHEDAVLAFFHRRTGRADVAADLTAETFARLLESRRRFDAAQGEVGGWLHGIARNVLLRSLERGRVEDEVRRRLELEPLRLDDADLLQIDEAASASTRAADALAAIPPEHAEAIVGRIVDERDYPALAAELGCSESVVRQRVSRGLRRLRDHLEARP
ncbi:MAG: RNA polymerase sigma factor [Patulibacter minatonensis]